MHTSDGPSEQTASPPPVFCRICGMRLQREWQFCTRCGAQVHHVVAETSFGNAATIAPGGGVGWGVGDVALGTGFYIIQAISIFALVLVAARVADVEYTGTPLLVGMLLAQLALPATVWFFAVSRRKVRWSTLGFWRRPALRDAGWGIVVLVAELAVQVVYFVILEATGVDTDHLSPTRFLEGGTEYFIGLAIIAVAIAPFAEELFFRGFMFAGLSGRWGPIWAAMLSSLLFMAAHLEPLRFPPLFVLGLLLAWLYHRTRALWASIFVHLLNNALAVGAMFVDPY